MTQRFPYWFTPVIALATGTLALLSCSDDPLVAQERSSSRPVRDTPPTDLPPKAAAMLQRFDNASYRTVLWVSADAGSGGDGTAQRPFATITDALMRARACTEIRVKGGHYAENVRFKRNLDGAIDCPIRLVSTDGVAKARIVAPDPSRPAIGGGGSENIMVEGFSITGGKIGIQFGQNGIDYTDMARNIVIRYNVIADPVDDGVKINGAETVIIAHNSMTGGADEAIDIFGAVDVAILRNRLGPMQTPSGGLTIKAGSRAVLVSGNEVRGISTQGIVIGGRTGAKFPPRPGYEAFEADAVRVYGNRVENVGRVPLAFLGARNSAAWNNLLSTDSNSPAVSVSNNLPKNGSRLLLSNGIRVWNNRYATAGKTVRTTPDSTDLQIEEQGNGPWNMPTGPDITAFRP